MLTSVARILCREVSPREARETPFAHDFASKPSEFGGEMAISASSEVENIIKPMGTSSETARTHGYTTHEAVFEVLALPPWTESA